MNVIVVVKVKIRTNRLTVKASNLGEKTLVSSFVFNYLLDLLFSANIKKKENAIITSYIFNTRINLNIRTQYKYALINNTH